MMRHLASPRIDEITDGANITARGVVVVRSLPVPTTTAGPFDLLAGHLDVPLHDPRRPLGRVVILDRAVAPPGISLPQRVLSP
jgi:hypothetical protein